MSDRAERWCPHCDVSTDLHGGTGDDIEPWECDVAARKADLMDRFFGFRHHTAAQLAEPGKGQP